MDRRKEKDSRDKKTNRNTREVPQPLGFDGAVLGNNKITLYLAKTSTALQN